MKDVRLESLAKILVDYSTKVKEGEKVFITAEAAAIPFIETVARLCLERGAKVETVVNLASIERAIMSLGSDAAIAHADGAMLRCVQEADVWISAWGSDNLKANSQIHVEKLMLRQRSKKEFYRVYRERMASGELRWCGTMFPTNANAQEASMSLEDYEDFVYTAGLVGEEDPIKCWEEVSARQEKFAELLNGKKELHIKADGTDIKIGVAGRKWINCDGKVNFPDGEVFTSPIETAAHGYITFTYPAIYRGREVENVRLTVENGKITSAVAARGEDFLNAILDSDEGSRFFGEIAIGTNYGIKNFTKDILFDEKIGGTIHMAAGDGFPECGGTNKSCVHWDMICDMRNGGEIYADGELIYKDGYFRQPL